MDNLLVNLIIFFPMELFLFDHETRFKKKKNVAFSKLFKLLFYKHTHGPLLEIYTIYYYLSIFSLNSAI